MLSCQLWCGHGKMRTKSSSDHCNSYSYIAINCTDAVFEEGWYLPVYWYFSMLAVFVEGEGGREAKGWTSKYSIGISEFPKHWMNLHILELGLVCLAPYLCSDSCIGSRYYLSRKLALLTCFDHHGCSNTTTITLIHNNNLSPI